MRRERSSRRQLVPGEGPLARIPAPVVFLAVATLFVVGVLVGGVIGAGLLVALAVLAAALLVVSWPGLTPAERVLRLLVLVVLLAIAFSLLD